VECKQPTRSRIVVWLMPDNVPYHNHHSNIFSHKISTDKLNKIV
jgi:hypothetical protein